MSLAPHVFQRLVGKIDYREGQVYFDKCGSLMVALSRILGDPFKSTLPEVRFGDLTSASERLVVRYGPDSVTADQHWLETPVRFEQVLATTWNEVGPRLDVQNKVTRCGIRAYLTWATDSPQDAQDALRDTELVRETEVWRTLFGTPKNATFAGISLLSEGRNLRTSFDSIEVSTEGRVFPDEKKFARQYAIQGDFDFSVVPERGELSRENLLHFVRSCLLDLNRFAKNVGELFHVEYASDNTD